MIFMSKLFRQILLGNSMAHVAGGDFDGIIYVSQIVLSKNAPLLSDDTQWYDIIECDFTNYYRPTLPTYLWSFVGRARAGGVVAFENYPWAGGGADPFVGNVVSGWALWTLDATPLFLAGENFDTPFDFSYPDSVFSYIPTFYFNPLDGIGAGRIVR